MKFITTLLLFISFSITVNAEIIEDIKVFGNKRLSPETIILFADIEKGKNYNKDALNAVLKKLYETNFLDKVNLSLKNNTLKITVIENPIIENIEITGVKNEKLKDLIFENLTLKNRQSYNENLFQNDLNSLKGLLKRLGYYFSTIETSLIKNDSLNSVILTYEVELGSKAKITEISFIGDKKFKDRKLNKIITSEVYIFWKFLSQKTNLDSERINLDIRLLENFYKNNGFYNVKILNSFVESRSDNSFKLTFNIDSGKKFYFNDIKINLPENFDAKYFESINKNAIKLKNKSYSLEKINKLLKEVDKLALNKQYEFIDAIIEEAVVNENKIDFIISMKDSEKFYIEKINIFGNQYTKEEVLRNALIVDEGDPLNNILFNKSINIIKSKNIFKTVKSNIRKGSNANLKKIDIIVEEKPTGEISLGAGVGTSGGTIGGGIKENNFMGLGTSLDTNIAITADTIKGKFSVIKPNYNYSDNSVFGSLSSSSSDKSQDSGYKTSDVAVSLGTTFQQYEDFYFNPSINIAQEKLDTTSTASAALKKQDGSYFDLFFNYSINYDLRDNAFQTKEGNQTFFAQELPLLSDSDELINTFDFSTYHELTNDVVGKLNFFMKTANSISDKNVRISKRLYLPSKKLRGFENGKVGPTENGDYIGGNYLTSLNYSASIPKILPSFQNLDATIFADAANIWGVDYDSKLNDSSKIRSSVGVAVDLHTVVGPMTFSIARPVTKASTDKTETFRFNIGTTF